MPRVSEQTSCDNPKVSVRMLTYNHERFIAQAIESVLMQETDFRVELIIGEDCSTDGTRRFVEEYARKFPNVIRAIFHERNVGVANNSDALGNACRGQYTAFLEGDDYWVDPQKLQKQVQLMEANPHYSMCGGKTSIVNCKAEGVEKAVGMIQPKMKKANYGLVDFLGGYPMHTSSILLRTDLVKLPSWLGGVKTRDTCIFALYAEKGPVGYLHECTSCYRLHGGGIWAGNSPFERIRGNRKAFDLLDAHFAGRYHRLLRRREYCVSVEDTRALLRCGRSKEAKEIFKEAIPRLVCLMPLRVFAWGFVIWSRIAWNHLTMFLAVRTRLRHLLHRLRTRASDKQ